MSPPPYPPPLVLISKNQETLKASQAKKPASRPKPKNQKLKKPERVPKQLLKLENLAKLKTYKQVSAPVPFFKPLISSKQPMESMLLQRPKIITKPAVADVGTSFCCIGETSNDQDNGAMKNSAAGSFSSCVGEIYDDMDNDLMENFSTENISDIIVETAEKSVQTECQCECSGQCFGRNPASNDKLIREVAKLSHIVRNIAHKITGKIETSIQVMFPINSVADLINVQHHIDNTENFQLKLAEFLQHLKPRNSYNISFALKEVATDEFFYGMNWSGAKKQKLKSFGFFNTTLFEAWKTPDFTKEQYVEAMRAEIKKSRDRYYHKINL